MAASLYVLNPISDGATLDYAYFTSTHFDLGGEHEGDQDALNAELSFRRGNPWVTYSRNNARWNTGQHPTAPMGRRGPSRPKTTAPPAAATGVMSKRPAQSEWW